MLLGPEERCGRRHPTARSAATHGYCGWSYRQIKQGEVEIQIFDLKYENVFTGNLFANITKLI